MEFQDTELYDALRKTALGFFEEEVEETDGKRKIKTKYHPPKIEAIRELIATRPHKNRFEFMTKEELIIELENMINQLKGVEQ